MESQSEDVVEKVQDSALEFLKANILASVGNLPEGMTVSIVAKSARALGLEVEAEAPDYKNCPFKVSQIREACGG